MPTTLTSALRIAIITSTIVWQPNYNTKKGRLKASSGGALPILQRLANSLLLC